MSTNRPAAIVTCSAILAILTCEAFAASDGEGDWRIHSQEPNGDVHFYDASRLDRGQNLQKVWTRIRYKTSVMGAPSYQSLLEINCSERTHRILQNTFFSDKHWKKPSMATDKTPKQKRQIVTGSAAERLSKRVCLQ